MWGSVLPILVFHYKMLNKHLIKLNRRLLAFVNIIGRYASDAAGAGGVGELSVEIDVGCGGKKVNVNSTRPLESSRAVVHGRLLRASEARVGCVAPVTLRPSENTPVCNLLQLLRRRFATELHAQNTPSSARFFFFCKAVFFGMSVCLMRARITHAGRMMWREMGTDSFRATDARLH